MPYEMTTEGGRYCVRKKGGETLKCYDDKGKAVAYLRALWANVHESVEIASMRVTKATLREGRMVIKMTSSDTGKDLYDEAMSKELFDDFISHVNANEGIPEPFASILLENESWTGGMPYISLAHYKSGEDGKNVPGEIVQIGRDGDVLKATAILFDTPLGRAVFKSLQKDLVEKRDDKIRVSIGFLDLEHSHGEKFTFQRRSLTDKCRLCKEGVGDKIYKKGHLVHLALTRVPANPRTDVEVERSMTTKREDAESIVDDEEVIKGLDLKSQTDDALVIKAVPDGCPCKEGDQECIDKWKKDNESDAEDAGEMKEESVVIEEAARKDVTPADKKAAEKEYGDVAYADETNKKYPIDTEEHIRAAWNYIHQERNAAKYSDHGAAIKSKIVSAWKKVIGGEPPSVEKSDAEPELSAIEKSLVALREKIAAIKSQNLTGDAALNELQADYAAVGETLKAEFTPPPSPEEVAKQNLESTLRSLLGEMLPQALAQTVAPIQSQLDALQGELRTKSLVSPAVPQAGQKEETVVTTVQRSIQPPTQAQKAAIERAAQKVSQFDLIARQSVGLTQ